MEYSFLGRSGLKVSKICLGTMTFGHDEMLVGQSDEPTAFTILDRYTNLGGNFIDTANKYCEGESETIIGNWINKRGKRDDLVIATKAFNSMDDNDVNCRGLSRKHLVWSIEESLKRLKTDYVDLFYLHCWDTITPLEETIRTLDDLRRSGKVHYLGASNFCGWQLQKLVDTCKLLGIEPFVGLQNHYCLLSREVEFELIDVCRNEGLGYLPWSPLKGGWLTGKYRRDISQLPANSRIGNATARGNPSHVHDMLPYDRLANERTWKILDVVEKIAKEAGRSMAQVSLRWLLQKDTVDSVIVGARTLEQLENNMGAVSWKLDQGQMDQLDAVSAPDYPYPYDFINEFTKERLGTS